jgi:hypothetical protein
MKPIEKKLMVWSVIAILVFGSLSMTFSIKLLREQKIEIKTQAFVIDHESLVLKQPELQNSNENTRDTENMELNLPDDEPLVSDMEPKDQDFNESIKKIEPRFPSVNMENSIQQLQIPREFEVPDLDRGQILTVGVAVYSDSNSTILSSIDWGNLEPGGNNSIVCYVKNTGQTISKLTLDTANWTPPEAFDYIALTWDYDERSLDIDEIILVTLTLNISNNIQGITEFFFDIIIIGSGV